MMFGSFLKLRVLVVLLIASAFAATAVAQPASAPASSRTPVVRAAITGGIDDNGFWQTLCEQFEKKLRIHVETVSTGQKDAVADLFKKGGIDFIAMYSSDAMMTLVADGFARDVQPFLQSDLILVGPSADPASVRGMTEVAAAFKKIADSKSALVIHASLGADVLARNISQELALEIDSTKTTFLLNDHQRQVLDVAIDKKAYTLISRVPFQSGKLNHGGLEVMVAGDPRLRRPYLLAVANPQMISGAHFGEAQQLAGYLRTPQVQSWIAEFNAGRFGNKAEFSPVTLAVPTTRAAGALLQLRGNIPKPMEFTATSLQSAPRATMKVKNEAGQEFTYGGVLIRDLLKSTGAPIGEHQFRGVDARRIVVIGSEDGYETAFSLTEIDDDFGPRSILLADTKDGKPLPAGEGPLRVIVPQDQRQARWARQATWIEVR